MSHKQPFFKSLLFRLIILNGFIVLLAIVVSSFAIYQTACFLVESMTNISDQTQNRFESLLLQYLSVFSVITVVIGIVLHYYLTKNLIRPIHETIQSIKKLKVGEFPSSINYRSNNEIGELTGQYNELIKQLKNTEQTRKKMISDLSHEIRTPISNLNGYLYALKQGDLEVDRSVFESLYEESTRLKQLIDHLDLLKDWEYNHRNRIIQKVEINIADLVNQSVSLFKWHFERLNIPINVNVEPCKIFINQEGIQQVMSILLDNAWRYSKEEHPLKIEGRKLNHEYFISVDTYGNPIPEEEQSLIFERFYRIEQSRSRKTGGSGLGLSIAKEIIEQHYGKIGVEVTGERNRFYFSLPISK